MKKFLLCVLFTSFVTTIGFRSASAQAPSDNSAVIGRKLILADAPSDSSVIKLDPALDELIAPDAKLELLKDNFTSAEGPAWVQQGKTGFLLFSDVNTNVVEKFEPGCDKYPCPIDSGKVSVYLDHAGFSQAEQDAGKISHPDHEGTVGLAVDPQGRILMADYGEHGIVRLEKNGKRTLLGGDTYEGKKFSCPNKLVIRSDGAIYFTDPVTTCIGGDQSPERQMDYHGFFLIKDGKIQLLGKDPEGGAPHGITMSPDEKTLYVGIGKKILAYDIKPDDTLTNERLFIDTAAAQGGIDGIGADAKGDLWIAGPGGIWIISPEGKHLGTISVPMAQGVRFANVAFGDPDRMTLYIVGNKNLWRIRTKVSGIKPKKS